MKYITDLSKEQLKQLSDELKRQIAINTDTVCLIADSYEVDRNETIDLYVYLQKKYCEKQDFIGKDLKFVKFAEKIAKKLLIKRG